MRTTLPGLSQTGESRAHTFSERLAFALQLMTECKGMNDTNSEHVPRESQINSSYTALMWALAETRLGPCWSGTHMTAEYEGLTVIGNPVVHCLGPRLIGPQVNLLYTAVIWVPVETCLGPC